MCVLQWLLKWQAENQAGRACVLSGFLSIRLNDQNEQRVWRVCSRWVFVVAVYATDLSCLFKITVMVFVKGVKKKPLLCWLRAVEPALAFLWPQAWEPLSDCSLSMWLGFRCLPASVNSKKRHQCFSQRRGRQLNFTHENTLCNSESTSDMVRGSTVSGLGNPHLTTSVSKCSVYCSMHWYSDC